MSLAIVAQGRYCETINEDGVLPNLKPLVEESVGQKVRRINQFIQLALIGAGRAATGLSELDGVYYASGCGDVEVTVDLMDGIYRHGLTPKPLSFVNSVSNAASYYVSKCLGLHGPSHFVTSRYCAFECALYMAALDIEMDRVNGALVGAVDIVLPPLEQHCERIGMQDVAPVAEASHWLHLCKNPGDLPVVAELESLQFFTSEQELEKALAYYSDQGDTSLAFNQFMDEAVKTRCLAVSQLPHYAYNSPYGHFKSRSGEWVCEFVASGQGRLLLVSGDPHGRYYLSCFSKTARS